MWSLSVWLECFYFLTIPKENLLVRRRRLASLIALSRLVILILYSKYRKGNSRYLVDLLSSRYLFYITKGRKYNLVVSTKDYIYFIY